MTACCSERIVRVLRWEIARSVCPSGASEPKSAATETRHDHSSRGARRHCILGHAFWRRRCVRYFRDFRPTNGEFAGVRTFGEQVKHAATMIYMTAAIVLEEKSPYGPGTNDNGPDSVQGAPNMCLAI